MHAVRNFTTPYDGTSFWAHYSSRETTVALFGKLTPSDFWGGTAAAIGFTSNTRDVFLSAHGITFRAAPGISPSVVEMTEGMEASNVENVLQFDINAITEEDLEAGKWNFAAIELWLMNYEAFGMGEFVVYSGYLGEIRNMQTFFKAEAEGGHSLLQNNYGDVTSRICRIAEPGAGQCQLDLGGTTPDGFSIENILTVDTVTDKYHIRFNRSRDDVPDDFYNHGKATAITGTNAGFELSREVKQGTGVGTAYVDVVLKRPFPFPVDAGDTFKLRVGDDKTLERCMYLGQVINRAAEDFIPGLENANRFPSAN